MVSSFGVAPSYGVCRQGDNDAVAAYTAGKPFENLNTATAIRLTYASPR